QRQARYLAHLISERLGACDVVTSRVERHLPPRDRDGNVSVRRLPTGLRGDFRHTVNAIMAFFYFLVHGRQYAVVHCHCLSPFVLGAFLGARLRGCKTLLKVCATGSQSDIGKVKRYYFGSWFWRLFLEFDAFVAQTPTMVSRIVAEGVPRDRIVMVPNAVASDLVEVPSAAMREAARQSLELPNRPTVLFVGRLVAEKRLDLLLDAWPQVVEAHDASLLVVGDGPERTRLEESVRASSHAASVRFFGWQDEPERYYRASELFVFTARDEAFGNVLAEAMAHGLAVITTREGLAEHWIRDSENGMIVNDDPKVLAHVLRRLLAEDAFRERLARQALADAREYFSPETVADRYLEIYRQLSSARGLRAPE
ncbi:MAG: glycosyltransferase family 4 protein, partial [Planctomycetota bacterium]|nr:glycosyltransferase family 4 protein [Planctomycetota bacterium]